MKIKESSMVIRDGYRFKHRKSWAILDDDGYVVKRFEKRHEVLEYIERLKEERK